MRIRPKTDKMVGERYGRLVVIGLCKKLRGGHPQVVTRCDCGRRRFYIQANSLTLGRTRSCGCIAREKLKLSPEARMAGRKGLIDKMCDIKPRFDQKVTVGTVPDVAPDFGPCHNWTGVKNRDGYGQIAVGVRAIPATHLAWLYAYEVLPLKPVRHICDNRGCVNPDHLYEASAAIDRYDRKVKEAGAVVIDAYVGPYEDVEVKCF